MYGRRCVKVGRRMIQVSTLHGYKLEELIKLQNTTKSTYTRLALQAVTMRYRGYSNKEIIESTDLSKVSIVAHIKDWNSYGLRSVEDHRGGKKPPKLAPVIVDDLIYVTLNKTPNEFEFIGHTWTLELLAEYIKMNYDIEVTTVTIWKTLKGNNLSYKRAQPMPTKANKSEQDSFKKNFGSSRYFRIFI
jgi:transposase